MSAVKEQYRGIREVLRGDRWSKSTRKESCKERYDDVTTALSMSMIATTLMIMASGER